MPSLTRLRWAALACAATFLALHPGASQALITLGAFATPDSAADVRVVDGLAYVALNNGSEDVPSDGRLLILDLSNPRSPVALGSAATPGGAEALTVVGALAYVAAGTSGLRIVDVSHPTAPVETGSQGGACVTCYTHQIEVERDLAFVIREISNARLLVFDLSQPGEPVKIGEVDLPDPVDIHVSMTERYSLDVVDGRAYLHQGAWCEGFLCRFRPIPGNFLRIIDVSRPETPNEIAALGTSGVGGGGVEVVGSRAYVANDSFFRGLQIVDVSRPARPGDVGFLELAYGGENLELAGGIAYIVARRVGLHVVNASNPTHPTPLGFVEIANAESVAIAGSLALVGSVDRAGSPYSAALHVVDVSEPSAPAEVGVFEGFGSIRKVEASGGRAYVLDSQERFGVRILNIADPSAPMPIGALELPDGVEAVDLEAVGDVVYVTTQNRRGPEFEGLHIFDVANPEAPFELAFVDFPRPSAPAYVAVVGGIAYVASSWDGIRVLDVTDPSAPRALGGLPGMPAYGIEVADGLAFVGGGRFYGLRIVDVANPEELIELGALPVWADRGFFRDYQEGRVAVADGHVYVAGRALRIVDLGCEYPPGLCVTADVRPGSERNLVRPDRDTLLPVALLGSATLDAASVDRSTLAFGPNAARPAHRVGGHLEDVDGDGTPDLVSHYRTAETGIEPGDTQACVTGETFERRILEGCDAIQTAPRE